MSDIYETLADAVIARDAAEVQRLVETGLDLNFRCDQGASPLFGAILEGNANIVELLLKHGADPNFVADEPAASIYADNPLDLARQARFLMSWDTYDPIVKLLELHGATRSDPISSDRTEEIVEKEAREWQAWNKQSSPGTT